MRQRPSRRRVLLVIGHGRTASLCQHLLRVARDAVRESGAEHRVHDLLADGFDPVLRLRPGEAFTSRSAGGRGDLLSRYQEDVLWADTYVIVHPVWWFAPPAILKGWVDRVLVDGVALQQRPGTAPEGLLGGRRALVVQTFNAAHAVDRIVFGRISELFWRRAVFASVGVRPVRRFALYGVEALTEKKLATRCRRLEETVRALLA